MNAPAFVVAGTGRSGSGYIAAVLTAAGIPCGHEAWFNPIGNRVRNLLGDSSWCSVAELDRFDGQVFHQVREPLAVVTSLVTVEPHSPYSELRDAICGPLPADPLERAAVTYLRMNERVEDRAELRWQVERVTAELVVEVAHRVCMNVSWTSAAFAIAQVPSSTNQHVDRVPLAWSDLPDTEATEQLAEMAERYGYSVP